MATLPNLARDLKSVCIEDENGSSDEELDDSLMAVGDPQTRRMNLDSRNEEDYKAWVPEANDPSLRELMFQEVQPACDLEENDLQLGEGHVAIAAGRRYCSLDQSEKMELEHLVDHYLHVHGSRIVRIMLLQKLVDFFRYKTHWRNVQDALLMKEMCTVIADLFISYSMNHSQDSQNSDQIHVALLDLLSAGCRGSMTACEFLQELQQICDDLVFQQGEGDQGPQPDSQAPVSKHGGIDGSGPEPVPEPGDASDSQGQQNLVLQQGEGDQGPQPDSQTPVSKHGGVDGSCPEPAPEPGDASDSQGQQGTSRKFV